MIAFPCPSCGVQLKVKDDLAGRMGKCPGCGRYVQVPDNADPPPSSPAAARSTAKRPSTPPPVSPLSIPVSSAASSKRPTSNVDLSFLSPPQEPDEMGRLGPYRVLNLLGAGSMGIVFRAEDSKLKRPAALKVMRPNFATREEYRLRFLREARATAKIDHSNVVPIYGVDENGGIPYLAMKLLEGESLEQRLANRGSWLPLTEVLRIGEEVCDALTAAHKLGLIHRDVKPTNIWIETDCERIKLIDFGLARVLDDEMKLTGTGFVVGTPSYMAPEQANGREVDHRSDLFSLGCVMYRASTGQVPFPGQFAVDVVAAVRTQNPKSPRDLDPGLPPSFSDLVMNLLAKDPNDRPQSAQEVRDKMKELRSVLTRASKSKPEIPTIPATSRRPAWKWTLLLAAAFAIVGSTVLFVIYQFAK